ncbi:DUF2939 domain-containing protein [Bradyrhizobium sp. MOS002]|uniref:DUF2939 domain-containing protein n=1 Tax=Bradyrhizobium sp. MOS002 TaxID=2133947 RepID=UPI001FDF0D32|nr:DUF2939 domain-containing protein [Bradyrhizobium sp. MOS002]
MKWLIGTLAAVLVCLGIYAGSAFVSLIGLVSAVRNADVAQVMARTDMPRVRHSLVEQVIAAYLDRLGQKRPLRPIERVAINAFGATLADELAAKLMTPENLAVLLKSGTVRNAADNITFGSMPSLAELDVSNLFGIAGRVRPVKPVEFALRLAGGENAGNISMHFAGRRGSCPASPYRLASLRSWWTGCRCADPCVRTQVAV